MFVTKYKIVSPSVIENFVDTLDIDSHKVIVKVDTLAICKADIRYFLGKRSQSVLNRKYPLAPIHEAVGVVIKDPTKTFKKGDKVILVPNSVDYNHCKICPNKRCHDYELGENYCPHATFRSSNEDGFLVDFIALSPSQLVKYSDSVEPEYAVFSELLSVAFAACRRIDVSKFDNIAIVGDGLMSYMVYLILVHHYQKRVTVFGLNNNKLKLFTKAKIARYETYNEEPFDLLFECVGGSYQGEAINEMIDLATIGANLVLMGVSEEKVAINTRSILEKGLEIKGVTRSTYQDFQNVSRLLENESFIDSLKPLVISIGKITSVNDIYHYFQLEINNTQILGKNIMKF